MENEGLDVCLVCFRTDCFTPGVIQHDEAIHQRQEETHRLTAFYQPTQWKIDAPEQCGPSDT